MADVFVSYSRKDGNFVRQLFETLKTHHRDAWVDWEGIPLTADWWREICTGIEAANTFLFVISPDSVGSPVCNLEIAHALQHNKRLVPIVRLQTDPKGAFASLAAHNPDDNLRKTLDGRDILAVARDNWQALSRHNWLFFNEDAAFEENAKQLISALDTDLDYIREHTRLLVRAREWERKNQNSSLLLRGTDLGDAEVWLAANGAKEPKPTEVQTRYIFASRHALNRQQRSLLIGVSVALVLTLILAGLALAFYQNANVERDRANSGATAVALERDYSESLRLAAEGNGVLQSEGNMETAALLGIAALNQSFSPQADAVLVRALDQLYTEQIFQGHEGYVASVAFSPDGTRVVTGSDDETARLWNVETGEQIALLGGLPGVRNLVTSVAFSPDGRHVLAGYNTAAVRLWSTETGEEIRRFSGHGGNITSVTFSPDGRFVLSGSLDMTARLWDLETGEQLRVFSEDESAVNAVAFSPDSTQILTGSGVRNAGGEGTLLTLDMETGEWLVGSLPQCSLLCLVRLWDAETGEELEVFSGHEGMVTGVAFSPDGNRVASSSFDGTARIWDVETGEELVIFTDHNDVVNSVALSSDALYLLTSSADGTARLWDSETGALLRTFSGHEGYVGAAVFSPNGAHVLSGGGDIVSGTGDRVARLWNATLDAPEFAWVAHESQIHAIAFSPDGTNLITGDGDGSIRLWDVASQELVRTFFTGDGFVSRLIFSSDGSRVLASHNTGGLPGTGTVWIWDAATGEELQRFSHPNDSITYVALSPDNRYVLTAGGDQTARLWDAETGEELHVFTGHESTVYSAMFSPDGSQILTTSGGSPTFGDRSARLWDVETGEELLVFEHPDGVLDGHFLPDGQSVVTVAGDGIARIWSTTTGEELRTYPVHTGDIYGIAVSADGAAALTGSQDGSARLWEVSTGRELRVYIGHESEVYSVALSPDGRFVASGDRTGRIRLWETDYHDFVRYACTRIFRDFTPEERRLYSVPENISTCW